VATLYSLSLSLFLSLYLSQKSNKHILSFFPAQSIVNISSIFLHCILFHRTLSQ
jgi:hypothetical protein